MQWVSTYAGRAGELARLTEAVRAGSISLVLGEAGIGKSRLAYESGATVADDGWLVVSVSCLPLAQRLPLLPVVDVLHQVHAIDQGEFLGDCLQECPTFVAEEIARLVPEVTSVTTAMPSGDWQRQRLFTAVLHGWSAINRRKPLLIVIEDGQWADGATQDFLSYFSVHRPAPPIPIIMTARSEELSEDSSVTGWLRQVVSSGEWSQLELTPLSAEAVEAMAVSIAKEPLTSNQVRELVRRGEGNPFFTEQLLAAGVDTMLNEELAQLLRARVAAAPRGGHDVLRVLAVAARPLSDRELSTATGQTVEQARGVLRALLGTQLARLTKDGLCTSRHALLGEAVTAGLFADERTDLHAAVAEVLIARADPALAAETAHHLSLGGREHDELPLRIAAAEYSEQVGGFTEAFLHWSRAVELAEQFADEQVAQLSLHSANAAVRVGIIEPVLVYAERGQRAAARCQQGELYAALSWRTAWLRLRVDPELELTEMQTALDAFRGLPPSTDQVDALLSLYWIHRDRGTTADGMPYLRSAVELEAALDGVAAMVGFAYQQLADGNVRSGLDAVALARVKAGPDPDLETVSRLAVLETDTNLKLNRLEAAAADGLRDWHRLKEHGWADSFRGGVLLYNVGEALRARGDIDQLRRIVKPLTATGDVGMASWTVHQQRCWVELCDGLLDAATTRVDQILRLPRQLSSLEDESELGQLRLELILWKGAARVAVDVALPSVARLAGAQTEGWAARLLTSAMWACADVVENAHARRDEAELRFARRAAETLQEVHASLLTDPFAEHPFFVTASAEGQDWSAELNRCGGDNRPEPWLAAAQRWQSLGRPHRAGYAEWRAAQSLLHLGQRKAAVAALRRARRHSEQHVPLTDAITSLARMARVSLELPVHSSEEPRIGTTELPAPFGLTRRELDVLRLLVEGLTNAQIGSRLYMSPKTASVHVTAILRKLQAVNRVHAAAIAQRIGIADGSR